MRIRSTKSLFFLLPATLAVTSGIAQAACNLPTSGFYDLAASINGQCGTFNTNQAQTFLDKFTTQGLQTLAGATYTGTEVTSIQTNFNSLLMNVSFPNAGFTGSGAQLNLSIPALGINKTFQGATRDDSRQLFDDYVKKSGIIGDIMKYQAANTAHSPIAGPGGAIPTAVATSFNDSFTDTATNIAGPASEAAGAKQGGHTPGLAGVALQYSALKVQDANTNVVTLPLSYTIRNDIDPRRQLVLSMPISAIDADGAKAYGAGLGAAYRFPMNDNWTLTPGIKLSAVGSKDLATLAAVGAGSITSTYIWPGHNYDVAMGNMIGYYRTIKVTAGDYSADPNINSTVFRNGVLLSHPVTLNGHKMSLEYSLIDTRYTGTKFYVDNTQEIGITIGTNKHAYSARSFFRAGLSYLHGKDTNGVTANVGYWF
jgi:hypothetical protein